MRTYGLVLVWLMIATVGCGENLDAGGSATCGDGVVEGAEACDDGLSNSDMAADACRMDCTTAVCGDGVTDTGEECDGRIQCENCVSLAVCGDEIVGGSEECEPGTDDDCHPVGHVRECTTIRTAFKMTTLELVDPGFWIGAGPCGSNLADTVNEGLMVSVNGDRASGLAPKESLDGVINLGFVFTMAPPRQGDGESTDGEFVLSDCIPPAGFLQPTPCAPTATQEPFSVAFSATSQTSGTCLEALDGTTGPGLTPEVQTVLAGDGACWVSDPFDWTLSLGSIAQIPLLDVQVASRWDVFEVGELSAQVMADGLIRGFLTREEAEKILISLLGGLIEDVLSNILSRDEGSPACQHGDTGPNGEDGWWMYLHFGAAEQLWEGGVECGNGVVDEGETCDIGIASGEGACEITEAADCDDELACTQDTINLGNPCVPSCFHRAIEAADSCCPLDAPSELPHLVGDTEGLDDPDCT